MKTWDSLRAIGDDLQAPEFSLDPLPATSVYDVHSGDGRVWMAAGNQGLLQRASGSWRSIPIDTALHADNVWQVASLPDGGAWMVVTSQPGFPSRVVLVMVVFILIAVAGALAWYYRSGNTPKIHHSVEVRHD